MPDLDLAALTAFAEALERAGKKFPEMRRELHEELAEAALEEVQDIMGGGKVASWQESHVGSRGGYAAVRPRAKTYHKGYAVGWITNAIEHGHAIRRPSGYGKNYRARIKKGYVLGKGYYKLARTRAERITIDAANKLLDEIARDLK